MKTTKILIGLALAAGIAFSSCQEVAKKNVRLTNEIDTVSYALGLSAGTGYAQNLSDLPIEINKEALISAFIKGLKGDTAGYQINQDDLLPILQTFFSNMQKQEREDTELRNTQILYENRQKEGVQQTASGLQFRIITEGKGKIPAKEDYVRVHYTGRLADGTIFDSSIERGRPEEFPAGALIPGWTEALTMMPVGSEWELVIPSYLGYGESPVGNIPGNSVLFFEVQLLDIVKKK